MRQIIVLLMLLCFAGFSFAADTKLATGDPKTQTLRIFSATGTGVVSSSLTIPQNGTQIFEIVSITVHLSAAGTAGNFTVIRNLGLGAAYDVAIVTQDMTTITDLFYSFAPGEFILQNTDSLDFAWANASGRTYGVTVTYKVK